MPTMASRGLQPTLSAGFPRDVLDVASTARRVRAAMQGAARKRIVTTFPTSESLQGIDCPICLDSDAESMWRLLPCGHTCHDSCLRNWVQQAPSCTCPLCRCDLQHAAGIAGQAVGSAGITSVAQARLLLEHRPQVIRRLQASLSDPLPPLRPTLQQHSVDVDPQSTGSDHADAASTSESSDLLEVTSTQAESQTDSHSEDLAALAELVKDSASELPNERDSE
mmetsp:Transcript_107566/g.195663  ORF Transcript_107566/g.195663 Transcript_107566/m.195663 type:complete len:223 (-) Transcript_107566:79-747(-)